ncbi:MAG TPA: class I SAM-dependent methyltransferase [Gemmatimonadaceae bacterium]|jgi:SAM-dependent methyltransferase|nr:class I SAM-dependent methyltransferase [Gemmatimonadaceae bacterium]
MKSSAVVAGRGFEHDTDSPDIHTASDAYARRFTGGGRVALIRQAQCLDRMLDSMGAAPLRVLDVGGGHAQTTDAVLARGHDVVVHGSDSHCFERLAPIANAHPGRISSCTSSMLALPFANDSFDLVMALRLMAHVSRWRELLAELLRVTRRYLVVDFPILGGVQRLAGRLFRLKMRVEGNTRPFFLYDRRDVIGHLHSLGATPVVEAGEMVLPMALHRMVGNPAASMRAENLLGGMGLRTRWGSPVLLLATKNEIAAPAGATDIVRQPPAGAPVLPITAVPLDVPASSMRNG